MKKIIFISEKIQNYRKCLAQKFLWIQTEALSFLYLDCSCALTNEYICIRKLSAWNKNATHEERQESPSGLAANNL